MFLTNLEQIKMSSYGKQIICDTKKNLCMAQFDPSGPQPFNENDTAGHLQSKMDRKNKYIQQHAYSKKLSQEMVDLYVAVCVWESKQGLWEKNMAQRNGCLISSNQITAAKRL